MCYRRSFKANVTKTPLSRENRPFWGKLALSKGGGCPADPASLLDQLQVAGLMPGGGIADVRDSVLFLPGIFT